MVWGRETKPKPKREPKRQQISLIEVTKKRLSERGQPSNKANFVTNLLPTPTKVWVFFLIFRELQKLC